MLLKREKVGLSSDFPYDSMLSLSTQNLLTVVSDRITGVFDRSGATGAVTFGVSKTFDRV